jgi:hypothetical protein
MKAFRQFIGESERFECASCPNHSANEAAGYSTIERGKKRTQCQHRSQAGHQQRHQCTCREPDFSSVNGILMWSDFLGVAPVMEEH